MKKITLITFVIAVACSIAMAGDTGTGYVKITDNKGKVTVKVEPKPNGFQKIDLTLRFMKWDPEDHKWIKGDIIKPWWWVDGEDLIIEIKDTRIQDEGTVLQLEWTITISGKEYASNRMFITGKK